MDLTGMEDWQQRRSRFNHDWLKNRYLNRLNGFLALLSSSSVDGEMLDDFINDDFREWEKRSGEARDLVTSFERDMSPQAFVTSPPLCLVAPETRTWLGEALHRLWLSRYPVAERIASACAAVDDVDRRYEQVRHALVAAGNGKPPGIDGLREMRGHFEALRDACQQLGDRIGDMPHEVLLV